MQKFCWGCILVACIAKQGVQRLLTWTSVLGSIMVAIWSKARFSRMCEYWIRGPGSFSEMVDHMGHPGTGHLGRMTSPRKGVQLMTLLKQASHPGRMTSLNRVRKRLPPFQKRNHQAIFRLRRILQWMYSSQTCRSERYSNSEIYHSQRCTAARDVTLL